jgi:hypothetical protein
MFSALPVLTLSVRNAIRVGRRAGGVRRRVKLTRFGPLKCKGAWAQPGSVTEASPGSRPFLGHGVKFLAAGNHDLSGHGRPGPSRRVECGQTFFWMARVFVMFASCMLLLFADSRKVLKEQIRARGVTYTIEPGTDLAMCKAVVREYSD